MISISVIIPVYNSADTITRCIESVLAQSYKANEIIVVDDGSTDSISKILRSFKNNILYIYQDNFGPSTARNKGVDASGSDWIAFLDADDEWLPEKLHCQVELAEKYPELGLIFTGSKTCYIENNREKIVRLPFNPHQLSNNRLFRMLILNNFVTPCSSVMCRKDIFKQAGGFNTKLRYSEDWDLWLRMSHLTQFGYVPQSKVIRYDHVNSVSRNILKMSSAEVDNLNRHVDCINDSYEKSTLKKKALINIYRRRGDSLLHSGDIVGARCAYFKMLSMAPLNCYCYLRVFKSMIPEGIYLYLRKMLR